MIFTIPELNYIVLQTIQACLKQDFEAAKINFSLSDEVASMIKDLDPEALRNFMSNSNNSLITLTHQLDNTFWKELVTSTKLNLSRLTDLTSIRSVLLKLSSVTHS